jgi:hypothetical protein
MNIEELAHTTRQMQVADYVAAFPDPALVFISQFGATDKAPTVDTPPNPMSRSAVFSRTTNVKGSPKLSGDAEADFRPDSLVVFMPKSARNPFANMITIGRSPTNDLLLPMATVSKVHGSFSQVGDKWRFTDSRSVNGTYVDGERLLPNEARALAEGSHVSFGTETHALFFTPKGLFERLAGYRRAHGKPVGGAKELLLERRGRYSTDGVFKFAVLRGDAFEVSLSSRKATRVEISGAGVGAAEDLGENAPEKKWALVATQDGEVTVTVAVLTRDRTGTYRIRVERSR